MRNNRYRDWLNQAKDDLKWAEDSIKTGHHAGACFLCQQVAEKALKALAFSRGFTEVRSHSVKKIAESLEINGEIEHAAGILDQFYIATRYPDALPEGHPSEFYDEEQARSALKMAASVISKVEQEISQA